MLWLIVIPAASALTVWFAYLKPFSYWKNLGVNQIRPFAAASNGLSIAESLSSIYMKYPESRYIGMYQFYVPTLLIKDPELIKQLTIKDFDHFTDHGMLAGPESFDELWSKNLFSLKDIQMIASTSFGVKVDSLKDPENEFYLMAKEATNFTDFKTILKFIGLSLFPKLLNALGIGFFTKRVSSFFQHLLFETIRVREEQGIVRPDMINILLEVKNGVKRNEEKEIIDTGFAVVEESPATAKSLKRHVEVTNGDILAQSMIFFLAGFDVVATVMSFTCYELAINPDVQEKLRREIEETSEECNDKVTYEVLLKMKYLDMVVSESLRKWPTESMADRVCVKPYTIQPVNPGEPTINLKKGDSLWLPIYSIHRDPNYYPDPEKFDPERFSDENKRNVKPYTFMPFGVGPRACIGSRFALLEIKSVLFHLLNNFELVPVEKTMIPLKMSKRSFTLLPDGGFPLGLKKIKK